MATACLPTRLACDRKTIVLLGGSLGVGLIAAQASSDRHLVATIPAAIATAALAAWTDHRTGRIFNALTYPAAVIGLTCGAAGSLALRSGVGMPFLGMGDALLGLSIGLTLLLVAHAIGGGGMGDVKLAGALGALVGPGLIIATLLGVYAFAVAVLLVRWTFAIGPARLGSLGGRWLLCLIVPAVGGPILGDQERLLLHARVRLGPYFLAGLLNALTLSIFIES